MIVNFTKMHGLGNDFVVIDLITQGARLQKMHIKRISNRKFGIGCDQVIMISPPTKPDVDFFYKIFNADGQEVEQCGNGLRCAAKFFKDSLLTNKTALVADCLGGTANVTFDANDHITVEWANNSTVVNTAKLHDENLPSQIHTVSMGNPHGICIVDRLDSTPVANWGPKLAKESIFPLGANIGFMQIIDRTNIKLRTFERGAGLTLACGSNACAAVLVGKSLGLLDNKVNVQFEFGSLDIEYNEQNNTILMTGPANSVYVGRFRI